MEFARDQLGLRLLDGFRRASGRGLLVDLGQDDRALLNAAAPVDRDLLAVHDGLDGQLVVRRPVDAGGDDERVRAGVDRAAVVGHVRHAGLLTGRGRAHGVGVLADELAAVVDEHRGAFLLSRLVVPGAGEGDLHRGRRAHRAHAQEEGGVAGDHLRVGERADVADLRLIRGELARLDHLVELHARRDAGEVTALIDVSKRVVVVVQALGVGARAGRVAELHLRELLRSLEHERLMAEAVGKDDVAALVHKLGRRIVALLALGDVDAQDVLILRQAQLGAGLIGSVDEVEVIGGVFVVQEDESYFDGIGFGVAVIRRVRVVVIRHRRRRVVGIRIVAGRRAGRACHEPEHEGQTKQQSKQFLHF